VVVVVTRFDPFRDFDRLAERMLSSAADMSRTEYVLQCDLPGVDPGSVDVGVDGRVLTVRAQRTGRSDTTEWLTQERPTGTFVRQVTLGSELDLDRIHASYRDGVLTLTLPVVEQAKPRRIAVSHDGGQTLADARASEGSDRARVTAGRAGEAGVTRTIGAAGAANGG
jgi:HSP20 family protein